MLRNDIILNASIYYAKKKELYKQKKISRKLLDPICFWQTHFCAYSERLSSEQVAFME